MPKFPAFAILLALAGVSASVSAQTSFTINGTVLELGSDGKASLPLEGAEVSLIEFVLVGATPTRTPSGRTFTDSQGAYRFHPDHAGDYYIEAKKAGYRLIRAVGSSVKLDPAHLTGQADFTFTGAAASLTGRVVDEDGQPVRGLSAEVTSVGPGSVARVVTGGDGSFTATNLTPGTYVVRLTPNGRSQVKIEPQFRTGDLKTVDLDLEDSYWPGGASKPTASITVGAGGIASAGTIKIRKVPYYRVHVSVSRAECAAGEKWNAGVVSLPSAAVSATSLLNVVAASRPWREMPCTNDFLVTNLRPGSYAFRLYENAQEQGRWGFAAFDVSNKNIELPVTVALASQMVGRVIAVEGMTLPLDQLLVRATGLLQAPFVHPDAAGAFVLGNLKFPEHRIEIRGLSGQYYVKAIRVNGAPSKDGYAVVGPGTASQLEILIDEKPGGITGMVTNDGKPAAGVTVRLFTQVVQSADVQRTVVTDKQGTFQFSGLAPGDYHAVAVPAGEGRANYADILAQFAASGPTITVDRGGTASVTLPLSDPSH